MRPCPVCDSSESTAVAALEPFGFSKCVRCGAWSAGDLNDSTVNGSREPSTQGPEHSLKAPTSSLKSNLRIWRQHLKLIEHHSTGRRLLDVRCGSGGFLSSAAASGFDAEGIDPRHAHVAAATSGGLRATHGSIGATELGRRFDVITAWNAIGFEPNPVAVGRHLRSLLDDRGVLLIGTLDNASPVIRRLGHHWWRLRPPRRLFYYNQKALTVLLSRSGFELLGFERIRVRWVDSRTVLAAASTLVGGAIGGRLAKLVQIELPVYQGGLIVAVARPR